MAFKVLKRKSEFVLDQQFSATYAIKTKHSGDFTASFYIYFIITFFSD